MIRQIMTNDPVALDSRSVDFSYGNTISNSGVFAAIENILKNTAASTTQIQQAIDGAIRIKNILDAAPMVQAILILILFAVMPILYVGSKYDFTILGTIFGFYFILKFFTVLWFIAWFVDQNLILALYPDLGSWLNGETWYSPSKRILLNTITTFMYVGFPIAFVILMGAIRGSV